MMVPSDVANELERTAGSSRASALNISEWSFCTGCSSDAVAGYLSQYTGSRRPTPCDAAGLSCPSTPSATDSSTLCRSASRSTDSVTMRPLTQTPSATPGAATLDTPGCDRQLPAVADHLGLAASSHEVTSPSSAESSIRSCTSSCASSRADSWNTLQRELER